MWLDRYLRSPRYLVRKNRKFKSKSIILRSIDDNAIRRIIIFYTIRTRLRKQNSKKTG